MDFLEIYFPNPARRFSLEGKSHNISTTGAQLTPANQAPHELFALTQCG
jgi:hypothetical protein